MQELGTDSENMVDESLISEQIKHEVMTTFISQLKLKLKTLSKKKLISATVNLSLQLHNAHNTIADLNAKIKSMETPNA